MKFGIGDRVRLKNEPTRTGIVEGYVRCVNPDDFSIYYDPWIKWEQMSFIWVHGPYKEDSFELAEKLQEELKI